MINKIHLCLKTKYRYLKNVMRYDKKDRQQYRKQAEYATRQTERETENMRIICYKKDRDTWRCDQHIYFPSKHLSPVQKCGFESWLGKVKGGGGGRRGKGHKQRYTRDNRTRDTEKHKQRCVMKDRKRQAKTQTAGRTAVRQASRDILGITEPEIQKSTSRDV